MSVEDRLGSKAPKAPRFQVSKALGFKASTAEGGVQRLMGFEENVFFWDKKID